MYVVTMNISQCVYVCVNVSMYSLVHAGPCILCKNIALNISQCMYVHVYTRNNGSNYLYMYVCMYDGD